MYQPYLGHATPLALGLALALPHRRVLSLDGDGSLLLDLSVLPVIAEQNPPNLIVIVFDNEAYEATGGHSTFTAGRTDLAGIAREAGIRNASVVRQLPEFEEVVDKAFGAKEASFIAAKVEIATKKVGWLAFRGIENKYRLVHEIEKTENIPIIKPVNKPLPQDKMIEFNRSR